MCGVIGQWTWQCLWLTFPIIVDMKLDSGSGTVDLRMPPGSFQEGPKGRLRFRTCGEGRNLTEVGQVK